MNALEIVKVERRPVRLRHGERVARGDDAEGVVRGVRRVVRAKQTRGDLGHRAVVGAVALSLYTQVLNLL